VAVNTVTPKDMVGEQTAPARGGGEGAGARGTAASPAAAAAPAPTGSFGIQVIRGTSVSGK